MKRKAGFKFPHSGICIGAIVLVLCGSLSSNAQLPALSTQPEKTQTRAGNKQFEKENYTDAEANYKKALDKKANMPEATFNLGDAVYQQKRYEEAIKQFQLSAQNNPDPKVKAKAFHNLGNTYLEQKKWPEAINSYKESLKLVDNDKDTKYNLAYANSMIVKEKNEQKQKQKDKKDKKDDKKDQKQDPGQDKKNQKPDSPKDDQQSKNDQQKKDQQKGAQPKLTKEEAEKLLQALMNEEQKTNQKVQQKQMKGSNVKVMKDW